MKIKHLLSQIEKVEKEYLKLKEIDDDVGNKVIKQFNFLNSNNEKILNHEELENYIVKLNEEELYNYSLACDKEFKTLGFNLSLFQWPGRNKLYELNCLYNKLLYLGMVKSLIPIHNNLSDSKRKNYIELLKTINWKNYERN